MPSMKGKAKKSEDRDGYIVVEGFFVNGLGGGSFIAKDELEIGEILVGAGHLIRAPRDSSPIIQDVNVDASEEDETPNE